jgi:hypothetical protein
MMSVVHNTLVAGYMRRGFPVPQLNIVALPPKNEED